MGDEQSTQEIWDKIVATPVDRPGRTTTDRWNGHASPRMPCRESLARLDVRLKKRKLKR